MKKDTPFLIVGGDHLFSFALAKFFGYVPFSDLTALRICNSYLFIMFLDFLIQKILELFKREAPLQGLWIGLFLGAIGAACVGLL